MRGISAERMIIPFNHQQLAFHYDTQAILPDEKVQQQQKAEKEWFAEYVIKVWINKYFEVKLIADTTHIPSITSQHSDMPFHAKGEVHSKTESAVVKKVSAQEWLEYFHKKLNALPKLHQEIIKKKYLQRGDDGKFLPDDVVYNELHIGRTYYFIKKKEALYWLGLSLLSPINANKKDFMKEGGKSC